MHLLVSNHEAEVAAFRRATGATASSLRVVENNLSALSLIDSDPGQIRSLVITEHQDEGVNVETRTFVRNLAARTLNTLDIVVVGSHWNGLHETGVQTVATIQEAAAIVRTIDQLELVPNDSSAEPSHTTNGHVELEAAPATIVDGGAFERELEPLPAAPSAEAEVAEPVPAPSETFAPAVSAAPAAPPETTPEPAYSLADDIRDWTERNEQQRGQGQTRSQQTVSVWESIVEMMPSRRRARAEEEALDAAIRAPRITKCHGIAVISPKGGVGKSFLTYLAGNFLAEVRGDKVVAIDTNPDFGTLADQVRSREQQTVGTLLEQIHSIRHYSDLRRFTSKVESRLEVLAAPADPDVMATISAADYGKVYEQLRHYYDTVLFDCGTGFRDDITRFALQQCDQIVLVSAPLFITTGIVIRALGYLSQIGCDLSRVTLAINQVRNEKPLDIDYMRSRFGSRLNAIVEIPFDMQLYHDLDRGEFRMNRTQPSTRISIKRLVAEMVRHFE
jgi:MinD-like ATPase involved in chromosome partitioning or flagellar assembly